MNTTGPLPWDLLGPRLHRVRLGSDTSRGRTWTALCPGHDDHSPSLGIVETPEGVLNLTCFARKCTAEEITAAVGLTVRDLYPPHLQTPVRSTGIQGGQWGGAAPTATRVPGAEGGHRPQERGGTGIVPGHQDTVRGRRSQAVDDPDEPPSEYALAGFVKVPTWFFSNLELSVPPDFSAALLFFYCSLLRRTGSGARPVRVSVEGLATSGRCSPSTAQTHLRSLIAAGWVTVTITPKHDWRTYTLTGPTAQHDPRWVLMPGWWFGRHHVLDGRLDATPGLLFFYAGILLYTKVGRDSWKATYEELAKAGRCSEKTAVGYVQRLMAAGWLEMTGVGGRHPNEYRVIGPVLQSQGARKVVGQGGKG